MSEICEECEREVEETITTGDRGVGPEVCVTCYCNPGWYRNE